jgi:tripartite-type tricarboxylate transporter receptor subunit TctC
MRALVGTGDKRSHVLPDVPTLKELGIDVVAHAWWGILAPAGTPAPVLERLNKDLSAILDSPETRKRFDLEGAEVVRTTPAEFATFVARETEKWTRVVKEAGIKPE